MVNRAEQVIYGLVAVMFLTVYQFFLEDPIMDTLGQEGNFQSILVGNVMVWVFSVVIVFVLLSYIKRRKRMVEAI